MFYILYSYFVLPLGYVFMGFIALFNKKVEKSLKGRYDLLHKLQQQIQNLDNYTEIILFHCSSMGEYKQIVPLIDTLKKDKRFTIILSVFSPSAYENLDRGVADIITYLPIDFPLSIKNFLEIINPEMIIITKHDVWPNFLRIAKKRKIPTFLINAAFPDGNKLDTWYMKPFSRIIFKNLTSILTTNEKLKQKFMTIYPFKDRIYVTGDSRFDTVLLDAGKKFNFDIELDQYDWKFVAGSTWPSDEEVLIDAWRNLRRNFKNILFILVPHEVDVDHIYNIETLCQKYGISYSILSELSKNDLRQVNGDILIVDKIGILSKLYRFADIAYVGGGFTKEGLHSVLEPAAYGIPVLFGPNLEKSEESHMMIENKIGFVINNSSNVEKKLTSFLRKGKLYSTICQNSKQFVDSNSGATQRILKILFTEKNRYFSER